jgi:putative serine protease PepD
VASTATKRIATGEKRDDADDDRRFCGRCGSTLVDGRCPTCDAPATAWAGNVRRAIAAPLATPTAKLIAALVVVLLVLAGLLAVTWQARDRQDSRTSALTRRVTADDNVISALSHRISELEARVTGHPDVATVAKRVQASVVTIDEKDGHGSGFALQAGGGHTTLVTDFHVVADTWDHGGRQVGVRQADRTLTGTIAKVDIPDDLALVTVDGEMPTLERAAAKPAVGDPVTVVGSPLELAGTVTTGVVSAYRDNAVQFSAPISPGNSGGPLVDRDGRVIGVARAKLVADGAEGLGFAVPIDTVCSTVLSC